MLEKNQTRALNGINYNRYRVCQKSTNTHYAFSTHVRIISIRSIYQTKTPVNLHRFTYIVMTNTIF